MAFFFFAFGFFSPRARSANSKYLALFGMPPGRPSHARSPLSPLRLELGRIHISGPGLSSVDLDFFDIPATQDYKELARVASKNHIPLCSGRRFAGKLAVFSRDLSIPLLFETFRLGGVKGKPSLALV